MATASVPIGRASRRRSLPAWAVFTAEEVDPGVPRVGRDGTLSPPPAPGPAGRLPAPVWAQGQLVGHGAADVSGLRWPEPDRLR